MPALGGLLQLGGWSLDSEFCPFLSEIADSLRLIFEIFPFLGDGDGDRVRSTPHGGPGSAKVYANRSGEIIRWNRASAALFGYSAEEGVGKLDCATIRCPPMTQAV